MTRPDGGDPFGLAAAGFFAPNGLSPCHSGGLGFAATLNEFEAANSAIVAREDQLLALGQRLSVEQQALIGCGPFYGTNCDDNGIDLLNTEASVLLQSWPGFEGTEFAISGPNFVGDASILGSPVVDDPRLAPGTTREFVEQWTLTNARYDGTVYGRALAEDGLDRQQPGTVLFEGGPVATYYELDGRIRLPGDATDTDVSDRVVQLPGARSPIIRLEDGSLVRNPEWDPGQDGCSISNAEALSRFGVDLGAADCNGARTLVHPLANVHTPSLLRLQRRGASLAGRATFLRNEARDGLSASTTTNFAILQGQSFQQDANIVRSPGATEQVFSSELAALSYNFLNVIVSQDAEFDVNFPYAICKPDPSDIVNRVANPRCQIVDGRPVKVCSFATPQECGTVQGILGLSGVQRNVVRAGGNGTFGRRTFLWQSGGEAVLRFARRNVLGFSVDFAEDVTKSNFSIEATWINDVPRGNADEFDGRNNSDDFNITLSMDRPTFVNFMNANRTVFINTQWFFRYRTNFSRGNGPNGPWNLLGTVTAFTGFFQDRLNPRITFVYDVQSQSGGFLPEVQYRYNEAFSITVGAQIFFGRTQFNSIGLASIGPAANQQGPRAYQAGFPTGLGLFRDLDQFYMRLRYSF